MTPGPRPDPVVGPLGTRRRFNPAFVLLECVVSERGRRFPLVPKSTTFLREAVLQGRTPSLVRPSRVYRDRLCDPDVRVAPSRVPMAAGQFAAADAPGCLLSVARIACLLAPRGARRVAVRFLDPRDPRAGQERPPNRCNLFPDRMRTQIANFPDPPQRRGRDSNPRTNLRPSHDFQSCPFSRSGTSPGPLSGRRRVAARGGRSRAGQSIHWPRTRTGTR